MTRYPKGNFTGEVPIRKKDKKKERKQSVLRALADDQRMVQFDRWEMAR